MCGPALGLPVCVTHNPAAGPGSKKFAPGENTFAPWKKSFAPKSGLGREPGGNCPLGLPDEPVCGPALGLAVYGTQNPGATVPAPPDVSQQPGSSL